MSKQLDSSKAESQSNSTQSASSEKSVLVVPVEMTMLEQDMHLPAELLPFRDVKLHAKIKGFVSSINVDRGSRVKAGQVLITLSAPELDAQCNELKARVAAAKAAHAEALSTLEADRAGYIEIKAKLDSDTLTLARLRKAAHEPGAIAQNEIDIAQKSVEGDEARLKAAQAGVDAGESVVSAKLQAEKAASDALQSLEATRSYLTIRSPIDGVITERWVHEGDMAGVELSRAENGRPLLRLAQTAKLRLVVSVPESAVAGIHEGAELSFSVPAYPGQKFSGRLNRIGHQLDVQTRTMPVELDIVNTNEKLEPGMYATVLWRTSRPYSTLFVPTSAVVNALSGTFVVCVRNGAAEVVPVKTGKTMNDKVEVFGSLNEGDDVVLNATDEFKNGVHLTTKLATAKDIQTAGKHEAVAGE